MAQVVKNVLGLGVFLAVVSLVAAVVAGQRYGSEAYAASAVAAATVWIAGSFALTVVILAQAPQQRVSAVLLAMLIRMSLPMAVGIALTSMGGRLAAGGVFGLIVVHYLAALAVETPLTLRLLNSRAAALTNGKTSGSS